MNDLTKILTTVGAAMALSLSLPGCGESSNQSSGKTHAADDGHDHSGESDGHDGHDHAEGEHDGHDDHDHGEMRSLGTLTIAGTTLAVSLSSDIEPSSEVHLDLEIESGPTPAAVRFWIGDEAATGALKAKTDGHDDHFHGETEAPADLTNAKLWIEVETETGARSVGSVNLS
jgi:hypothetical protein